jgi:hypothetical protein
MNLTLDEIGPPPTEACNPLGIGARRYTRFRAMRPANGGHVRLDLVSADGAAASYTLELETPSGSWRGRAAVDRDGTVHFDDLGGDPPEWLCEAVRALLRSLWRSRTSDANEPWPRRLERWRPDPKESSR